MRESLSSDLLHAVRMIGLHWQNQIKNPLLTKCRDVRSPGTFTFTPLGANLIAFVMNLVHGHSSALRFHGFPFVTRMPLVPLSIAK